MYHSKIESILEKAVSGKEELEKKHEHFHAIEHEIDDMANKPEAEIETVVARAKELVRRLFGEVFIDHEWHMIEKDIEKNLKGLSE